MDTKSMPRIRTEKKQSTKHVMDNNVNSNEHELKWFLHRNRLLEKSYMMQNGMKKFWEGQFLEDWAYNATSNLLELNSLASQSCNSPSAASESSSSLSTRESSSFSGRSEMLQSPDPLSRFSIFNSEFTHSDFFNKQKSESCKLFNENVRDNEREYTVPFATEDWVSDSDESWASAASNVPNWEHGGDVKHDHPIVSKDHEHEELDDLHNNAEQRTHLTKVGKDGASQKDGESRHVLLESPKALTERSNANSVGAKDERITDNTAVLDNLYEINSLQCREGGSKDASFITFPISTNPSLAKKAKDSLVLSQPSREPDVTSAQGSAILGSVALSKSSSLHSDATVRNVSIKDDKKSQLRDSMKRQTNSPVEPLSFSPEARQSRYPSSSAVRDRYPSSSTQGYLRFAEQDGSLCYSFSVDASEEVYFARACKRDKHNGKKSCDWIYTFHSRRENVKSKTAPWKGWTKKEAQSSNLVGKMRVCNVKHGDANRETRFILFDDKKYQTNGTGIEDQTSSGPQRRQSQDRSGSIETGRSELHVRSGISEHGTWTCGYVNKSEMVKGSLCRVSRSRKVELAAIVISSSVAEEKPSKENLTISSEEEGSGWGIKFLQKGLKGGWGMKFLDKSYTGSSPHSPARSTEGSDTTKLKNVSNSLQKPYFRISEGLEKKLGTAIPNQSKLKKIDVAVILPAGDHGFPRDDIDDETCKGPTPTPLLERWKSGGVCDCGGWDMGCGLSVLKCDTLKLQSKQTSIALTNHDRVTWFAQGKPLKISTQGHNPNVSLMVETIQAGLFSLSFQARFSPLQAFATAVAMFHEQMTHQ